MNFFSRTESIRVPVPRFTTGRMDQRFNLATADRNKFYFWNLFSIAFTALPLGYLMKKNYRVCEETETIKQKLDPFDENRLSHIDPRLFCCKALRRALPPNLTPELWREWVADVNLMSCGLSEMMSRQELLKRFAQRRKPSVRENEADPCEPGGGIRRLFDCEKFSLHLGVRDLSRGEEESSHYTAETDDSGNPCLLVDSQGGRRKVTLEEHLQIVDVVKPDSFAVLVEDVSSLPSVGQKRIRRSVQDADRILRKTKEKADLIWPAEAERPFIFGSVQGGKDLLWREISAENCKNANTDGFSIGGLGYGESLAARGELLEQVMKSLRCEEKPRLLPLPNGHPIEVFQAIWAGIDLVECSFPVKAAASGILLDFAAEMPQNEVPDPAAAERCCEKIFLKCDFRSSLLGGEAEATRGRKKKKDKSTALLLEGEKSAWHVRHLDLRDSKFSEDLATIDGHSPVANYSRAYLHHLLKSGEMLVHIILTTQNVLAYEELFSQIRRHTAASTLSQYFSWFMRKNMGDFYAEYAEEA